MKRKFLLGYILLILSAVLACSLAGCGDPIWPDILYPHEGRVYVTMVDGDVELIFDLEEREITIQNDLDNSIEVIIKRRVKDYFVVILQEEIPGETSFCTKAYFDHYDEIAVKVRSKGEEWIRIFILG